MDVIRSISDLQVACDAARITGRSVGLVPTMGDLHDGHASLLQLARAEADLVVMSLFVNPLQFGDPADLAAYPRNEHRDLRAAERLGVDVVFAPTDEEMLPGGTPQVTVDPGPLGDRLEGASRPGHYRGVATVIARLFTAVGPSRAYFGEKDAQQLAVIRRMVLDLGFPVELVEGPTVRDPDGVALSSRNARLTPDQREAAGCLFLGLSESAELARGGETEAAVLVAAIAREVGATPLAALDYAVVVDPWSFEEVPRVEPGRTARAVVAATFGGVRLIDTLLLPQPP